MSLSLLLSRHKVPQVKLFFFVKRFKVSGPVWVFCFLPPLLAIKLKLTIFGHFFNINILIREKESWSLRAKMPITSKTERTQFTLMSNLLQNLSSFAASTKPDRINLQAQKLGLRRLLCIYFTKSPLHLQKISWRKPWEPKSSPNSCHN